MRNLSKLPKPKAVQHWLSTSFYTVTFFPVNDHGFIMERDGIKMYVNYSGGSYYRQELLRLLNMFKIEYTEFKDGDIKRISVELKYFQIPR